MMECVSTCGCEDGLEHILTYEDEVLTHEATDGIADLVLDDIEDNAVISDLDLDEI